MSEKVNLESIFDSLPESRIDSSEESESDSELRLTIGQNSANVQSTEAATRNRRQGDSGLDKTHPKGVECKEIISSTCRYFHYAKARNLPPEVDDYGSKTSCCSHDEHNGANTPRKLTKGVIPRQSSLPSNVEHRVASADDRRLSLEDHGGQRSAVPRGQSVTRVGLEEDYENDENCIITENDLGEIASGWTGVESPGAEDHGHRLNSSSTGSSLDRSDQLCQREIDVRKKRKAFYKQMLCSEPQQSQDPTFEPLESPSQVLKLIQRFQTRIDNHGEDIDLPEDIAPMEVSIPATPEVKVAIKKPPRVFPKKSPLAQSLSKEFFKESASSSEAPQSEIWKIQQQQPPSEEHAERLDENLLEESLLDKNLALSMIEPPEDYNSCDQEAMEAIEQLDKSIEEVILCDEDFGKAMTIVSPAETSSGPCSSAEEKCLEISEAWPKKEESWSNKDEGSNEKRETSSEEDQTWSKKDEVSSKEDVSCQTLTIDTNHSEKSAVSPVLTDEGFADGGFGDNSNKKYDVEESDSAVPQMSDASVNTDFDVLEETEHDLSNVRMDFNDQPFSCSRQEKEISTSAHFKPNMVEIAAPKQFRDKDISAEDAKPQLDERFSVPLSIKKQWLRGYPVYPGLNASSPVWPNKKLPNGHNDHEKDEEEGIAESFDIYSRRNLTDMAASRHRMSTATLDGAVVASMEDNSTVLSTTTGGHQGHFVVVAIDFGTTFSGYAFSFIRDPDNIHIMRKWEGGDPGVINQKTLTTVLLTPNRKFHSVGFTARDHYHDLDTEDAKRWLYFDKFKMALHHNVNLSEDTKIRATNGISMPAVTIFAHVLRFFREHALQELSDQSATRILNEDVRWVITVPAIWRQPAKQFMRQAAYRSGIASSDCPDQLLIALEPEAASIYCRKLKIHQLVSEEQQSNPIAQRPNESSHESKDKLAVDELRPGTRYMVVDCGGGTVDITVHEMADKKGNLKELHKPNGGPCGSVMVDAEFENLLNDIFGADFMEQFKIQRPAAFVDLMMAFEARKRNVTPFRNNPSNVSLPFSFVDYYKKCKGVSVETAIKKFGRKDIRWSSQGMLRLEQSAIRQLFAKVTEDIKNHISRVLRATNHTINYLFLVGGFAESQILQQEIRNSFSELKIIIPQGVSLAILKGAVLYGREPTVVSVRRSRMTYGVGVLNRFIPKIHPKSKLIVKDGVEWCTDVFDRFVAADESVGLGDVVLRSYTPAMHGQTNIVLHVYCSEKDNVSFITDDGVCRCGTLHLDLSDVQYMAVPKRREIQTRMIFGDTELKISALDVTTGKCVRAQLDFLNH